MAQGAEILARYLNGLFIPSADDVSDRQLMKQFAADKDEAAFAELVRRHASLVFGVCRRVLGDIHEAEDAFQATFLILAQKALAVQWRQSVAGWLYEVAYRTARKAKSKLSRLHAHEILREDCMSVTQPDREVERDLYQILDEEVRSLPGKYRLPIVLCYLQGKTNVEAARDLGCPAGTVKTRLLKARELLRTRLMCRGVSLSMGSLLAALAGQISLAAPTTLTDATIQIGVLVATDKLATASLMTPAWLLSKEVIQTMFTEKLKMMLVPVALLIALVVAGAGTALFRANFGPSALKQQSSPLAPLKAKSHLVDDSLPVHSVRRIGTVRLRHGSSITDLAFSPDGKMLASSGRDKVLRLWDLTTGKQIHSFKNIADRTSVAFSPDGRFLAAGDSAGRTVLWETATAKENWRLRIDKYFRYIQAFAFSPDGKILVGGDCAGQVRIRDAKTGRLLFKPWIHTGGTAGIAFSKDGRILATCDQRVTVHLLNVKTGKSIRTIKTQPIWRGFRKFALAPDGKTIVVGSTDTAELHIIDVGTGRKIQRLIGKSGFTSIAFLPDSKTLLSGGRDGTTRLWRVDTGKEICRFRGQSGRVSSVAATPDGKTVASAANGVIRVWDIAGIAKPTESPPNGGKLNKM